LKPNKSPYNTKGRKINKKRKFLKIKTNLSLKQICYLKYIKNETILNLKKRLSKKGLGFLPYLRMIKDSKCIGDDSRVSSKVGYYLIEFKSTPDPLKIIYGDVIFPYICNCRFKKFHELITLIKHNINIPYIIYLEMEDGKKIWNKYEIRDIYLEDLGIKEGSKLIVYGV
jgi:hypothetical protein